MNVLIASSAALFIDHGLAYAGTHRFDHVELQSFKGGNTNVVAINQSGQIAGTSGAFASRQAFVSDSSGVLMNINTLDYQHSSAVDLNDAGQVIGIGCHDDSNGCVDSVFRFTPSLGMENLGGLAGGRSGTPRDINSHGDVVGWWIVTQPESFSHAFLYSDASPTQAMQDLGTLGGPWSEAIAINDARQVIGNSYLTTSPTPSHGFIWQDGVMTDLGTLGGMHSGAVDINNAGTIVGWALEPDWNSRAFRYTERDGMQPLPLPKGAIGSAAMAINDAGMVLINYSLEDTMQRSALIMPDGEVIEIPLLEGFPTGTALAMNNLGHVIGANVLVIGSEEIVSAYYWSPETGTMYLDDAIISDLPWTIFSPVAINDADEILVRTIDNTGERSALLRPALPGDTNGDRQVNVDDLVGVILGWGPCPVSGVCNGDVDSSDAVDVDDLVMVILNWGS